MNIREKIAALKDIINDATLLIGKVRSECSHENGEYHYDSCTGNYCPSDDEYWRQNFCLDCGKVWTEYSEDSDGKRNPMYTKNPGSEQSNWKERRRML